MNKTKFKRENQKYTQRKSNNLHIMQTNLKQYSYIIALNINQISAHLQQDLKTKLYNQGIHTFKIVNKIALKIFNNDNLTTVIKGQILYVGANDLYKVMSICNNYTNIKPVIGIHAHQIINKNILSITGKFNREQLIGLAFQALNSDRLRNIINIFETINQ